MGSGEAYINIAAGINSLGNSTAGKAVCVRNNEVYSQTTISKKSGTVVTAPLTIKAHLSNTSTGRPQIKGPSTPLVDTILYPGYIASF